MRSRGFAPSSLRRAIRSSPCRAFAAPRRGGPERSALIRDLPDEDLVWLEARRTFLKTLEDLVAFVGDLERKKEALWVYGL
jgi:hypothetical protein